MANPLSIRTMSGFPLSIGTALAMESLFFPRQPVYDKDRPIPNKVEVKNYHEIHFNLATIFRNIAGAADKDVLLMVKPQHFVEAIESEIEIIYSLFQNEGQSFCKPTFYYCSYEKLYKAKYHNAVKFRMDNTAAQQHMTKMLVVTMKELFKANPNFSGLMNLDSTLKPSQKSSALIMTHMPYDLLNYPLFNKLDLIESHTGKLKPRNLWYTKFYQFGKEDLNTLPFQRKLWLIFGDNVMVQPMDIKFRRLILEISRNRRWTPLTTESKVLMDLDLDIKERYLFEMYRDL